MNRRDDPSTPRFELVIEELALDGFPATQRHAIAAAMEGELTRLFQADIGRAQSNAWGDLSLDRLQVGALTLAHGASPETVGRRAARVVHAALSRTRQENTGPPAGGARR